MWAGRQLKGDVVCCVVEVSGISLLCHVKGFWKTLVQTSHIYISLWAFFVPINFQHAHAIYGNKTNKTNKTNGYYYFFLGEGAPFQAHRQLQFLVEHHATCWSSQGQWIFQFV